MKVSPNTRCPCGSGAKLKVCCAVAHRGRPVPPSALMRARYTAYVIGAVDFLIDTTDPDGPHARADRAAWRRELAEHCRATEFHGLTVHSAELAPGGDEAWVTFSARMTQDDVDVGFTERSLFRRAGDRWRYVSGEFPPD